MAEPASNRPACPQCGRPLPAAATDTLCPGCLMQQAMMPQTEVAGLGPEAPSPGGRPAPPAPVEMAPHFPQLEILECLGRGGMGVVYKARQPRLDRLVALKVLAPEREKDPAFANRFEREAQALARLNHPNIVTVHDFGRAGGLFYLLMEYVDGTSLRHLLRGGRLPPEQALAIVPALCEALEYAHARGVVHRDIKPENILLDPQGRVKIADFGVAKILGSEPPDGRLTAAEDVVGTPHYMAPEQVETPQRVDHRADIYSLGVVFYEMLTGELPLGKFPPPSRKVQVDVRLDEVVLHALEKEPDRRYQHASEVKTEVEALGRSALEPPRDAAEPATAGPPGTGRTGSARPWLAAKSTAFLIAALCFVVGTAIWASRAWSGDEFGWETTNAALNAVAAIGFGIASYRHARAARKASGANLETTQTPGPPWPITLARWTARLLGTLGIALVVPFVLADGLPPVARQPAGVQLTFVAGFLLLCGFGVGWWREGTAALLVGLGWTMFCVSESEPALAFHVVLLIAALYALCWWSARTGRTLAVAGTAAGLALVLALGRWLIPVNVFVTGRVTDATTHHPIPGAEVRVPAGTANPHRRLPNARTGDAGQYQLYLGWYVPGRPLEVVAPGYDTLSAQLGPRPLGQRRLSQDFTLVPLPTPDLGTAGLAPPGPVPPVVVQAVPESGRPDVDPGLTEIRVTFSEPMQADRGSLETVAPGCDPEITGTPHFLGDQRTFVLPVRLEAGRVYGLWINSTGLRHFTDQAGEPALPYLWVFRTRDPAPTGRNP